MKNEIDKLVTYIIKSEDYFTIDDILKEFDFTEKELKRLLDRLKDMHIIIQAGSRYLKI